MTSTITAIAAPAPEERSVGSGQIYSLDEYSRLRKDSDKAAIEAMTEAGNKEPEALAVPVLQSAGFTLAPDRVFVRSLVQGYPASSPVHLLSLDAQLALASQGHAFAPRLLELAEKHLLDGLPASVIGRSWAEKRAKDIRDAARAVRQETRAASEPPSVIIERLKEEVNMANARAERAEQAAEQALALAEELAARISRLQQGFIANNDPSQNAA